jgi:restriction endonuclease S subunit
MKTIVIRPSDVARTFTLVARPDTHYFIEHDLPEFLESLSSTVVTRFRNYINSLRSGEYIPKEAYSDTETKYIYLTIGQFSGEHLSFEDLTFLDESVGEKYQHIKISDGDLIITRSGTVGVVHIFRAPDDKIYIPSHHLSVVQIPEGGKYSRDYLRLFLQSEFARRYFWAFATGKGQKEISNWSIKSIPIPQCENPLNVAGQCLKIEEQLRKLSAAVLEKKQEKEIVLYQAIRKG